MGPLAVAIKNQLFAGKSSERKKSKAISHEESDVWKKEPVLSADELTGIVDEEKGAGPRKYFEKYIDLSSPHTFLAETSTRFNILKLPYGKFSAIVNLRKVNDFRRINKFFEAVNDKLPLGGTFIGSVEVYTNRKKRILKRFFFPFNRIYYFFDVLYTRVMPKLPVLKNIYYKLDKKRYRVLSKSETFGRLYSCGFKIVDEKTIANELFFVAKKTKEPAFDDRPTYGPLVRLKRRGKDGKIFTVYKLRTMYAYSEYLQEYVYEHNNLRDGGKFKDDFRVTTEGRFFRKFWIDEFPMIFNLLKGDLKLVGVRPLSDHYFNLYSEELKQKRIKHKHGLVPPFYADMPKTLEEIMASEMRYLEAYEKHPFRTDVSYFFKALYNILIRRVRSR